MTRVTRPDGTKTCLGCQIAINAPNHLTSTKIPCLSDFLMRCFLVDLFSYLEFYFHWEKKIFSRYNEETADLIYSIAGDFLKIIP